MQESLFVWQNKVAGLLPTNLFLKGLLYQHFSVNFAKEFHGTFFAEYLRATASTKHHFVHWVDNSPKMLLSTWFFLIFFKHFPS